MSHARPHLTTHTRSKGHSALAGVAYRLGLRLYDKRQGVLHDYRHRFTDNEVVAAFTLAPVGAPDWATDPEKVWTAVEAAEKRKDSQIGHDFRIPIPFGLSDEQAEAMARNMAQHIVSDWHTIVSVGLHRDSPVDAMGFPKPLGKQGFHAHLYFPTRAIAFDAEAVRDPDDNGQGGSDGWSFGEKLAAFSKKKAAAVVITHLNSQWATLANTHVLAIGGVPDFTHLSYKRLGLAKVPQLRLGPGASALERKGIATQKGDTLRAAAGHNLAPMVPPLTAVATMGAPSSDALPPGVATATVALPAVVSAPASVVLPTAAPRDWLNPANPIAVRPPRASDTPVMASPPDGLAARFLAELARKPELPQPTAEQRSELVGWLNRIERALKKLASAVARLLNLQDNRSRDNVARATFAVELDDRRRRREEAQQAVTAWLDSHPWQLRLAKALGGTHGKPAALVEREGREAALRHEMQQLRRGVDDAAGRIVEWDARIALVQREQDMVQAGLKTAVQRVRDLDPLYGMVLLSVAEPEHVPQLSLAMPEAPGGSMPGDGAVVALKSEEPSLVLKPSESHRARPAL